MENSEIAIYTCDVFDLFCLEGKPIPTELRKDEAELRKAIEFDDERHEREFIHICTIFIMYQSIQSSLQFRNRDPHLLIMYLKGSECSDWLIPAIHLPVGSKLKSVAACFAGNFGMLSS